MTPEELDEARAKEAERLWSSGDPNDPTIPDIATVAARLARENWTPPEPEPVNPDIWAFMEWWGSEEGDGDPQRAYLAGARMAREQERERAKVLVEYVEIDAVRLDGVGGRARNVLAKYRGEA